MMISHDLALVSMVCDRIMVLKDGAIVETGITSDVINSPQHEYTRDLLNSVLAV
jgi:ABC-type dipeptide/oligopeptide/nickel transport system ATPase component